MPLINGQLKKARLENLAAAPASPGVGRMYWDTVLGVPRIYSGSVWSNLIQRAVAKTGAYTVTDDEDIIKCDASSAAFTVTLPAAANRSGRRIMVVKTDASGNAVTIDGNAAETIDGVATQDLTTQYQSMVVVSDGTGWFIE